jgi:hypothetical protein
MISGPIPSPKATVIFVLELIDLLGFRFLSFGAAKVRKNDQKGLLQFRNSRYDMNKK